MTIATKAPRMSKTARYNSVREGIKNIVDNAYRFYWTTDFLNASLREVWTSPNYLKLRQWERTVLSGYLDGLRANEKRMITHCYLCNDGKFRRTTNVVNCGDSPDKYPTYTMPSEGSSKGTCLVDGTCILVWKDNPDHVYSTAGCDFLANCKESYKEHTRMSDNAVCKITLNLDVVS
jgi:hypothetical protein